MLERQRHDNRRYFFSHFEWVKVMVATRQDHGKRNLLDSAWAVKLFVRLTKLSWSDVHDPCASSRHFSLAQKKNH